MDVPLANRVRSGRKQPQRDSARVILPASTLRLGQMIFSLLLPTNSSIIRTIVLGLNIRPEPSMQKNWFCRLRANLMNDDAQSIGKQKSSGQKSSGQKSSGKNPAGKNPAGKKMVQHIECWRGNTGQTHLPISLASNQWCKRSHTLLKAVA